MDPRRSPYCALPSTDVTSLVTPPPLAAPAASLSSGKDTRERSAALHSAREAGAAGGRGGGGGREEACGVSSSLLYHQHSVHIHGKGEEWGVVRLRLWGVICQAMHREGEGDGVSAGFSP